MRWLSTLLTATDASQPLRVAAVTGTGGVGKSALAVHVAHRLSARFPAGQLFVDLQGSSQAPVPTSAALARLLRHLGVPDADIPADVAERAAEFRTRMADLAMLIVLDDAADAAQVRLLLPGNASSAVLITSRGWLADLEGARVLALGALDRADAHELFAGICGRQRVSAEPDATDSVLGACAGLPMAIRIAAARLVSRPGWQVGSLATLLSDEVRRLTELAVGDLAVRASFQVSYTALRRSADRGEEISRAFRLLGLWHGPDVSRPAAAALLGCGEAAASELLERLVDIHMLDSPAAHRYRFHDLVRVFAAECASQDESAESRTQALARIVQWYSRSAASALTRLELPPRRTLAIGADPAIRPMEFADYDSAAAWLQTEQDNLANAVSLAAREQLHDSSAQLAEVVWYSFKRSPWDGWLSVLELGVTSAAATGNVAAQAWLHNYLGIALLYRGRCLEALDHLELALPLSRQAEDRECEATVVGNLGIAHKELNRFDTAIEHFEQAMRLDPDPQRRGRIMMNLGMINISVGRLDDGAASMESGMAIISSSGDLQAESLGWTFLAQAYRHLGRYGEAVSAARKALEISRRLHDDYQQAAAWTALGEILVDSGQLARGRSCLTSAYRLADRLGVPEAKQLAASIAALPGRD